MFKNILILVLGLLGLSELGYGIYLIDFNNLTSADMLLLFISTGVAIKAIA